MRALPAAVFLVVLLAGGACAPAAPGSGPAPSPQGAVAGSLLRLEDRREHDPATFASAAVAPESRVRARAALAAGRIRDPRALPLLLGLLADPDTAVAATAAFALGQLGDTAAVPALAAAVRRGSAAPTVASEAAYALGKLHVAAAREALVGVLVAGDPTSGLDAAAVGSALRAVWRHPGPVPVDAIAPWLRAADPELREGAAYALSRRPSAAATAALFAAVGDPSAPVRSYVARGLGAAVADSAGIGRETARVVLLRLVASDPDRNVRINAVRTLGSHAPAALAEPLAAVAGADDDYLALVALETLQQFGTGAAPVAVVLERLATDAGRPIALRQAALLALASGEPEGERRVADGFVRSDAWRLRAAAVRALMIVGEDERVELIGLVGDPDGRIAAALLDQAATTLRDHPGGGRMLLIQALDHADPVVRAAALAGLARTRQGGLLPLAFEGYRRALADTVNDATLAAVAAIGALAAAHPDTWPAFFTAFPRSEDPLVRMAVRSALGDSVDTPWGEPLPVETGLGPEAYARITEDAAGRPTRRAAIETDRGTIVVELFHLEAPLTVRNFLELATAGYFDGQEWPRVVPNFVIQGGDPRGDTSGGPGYSIRDEINRRRYERGTLGMALSGPDTGGSQWFLTHSPQPHLDGTYTIFGRVLEGWGALDAILPGDRIIRIREVR
jgi:cyclophilin family peptidyl-prolyl cis-trans isomerase/HEAT repeat protein